MRVLYAAAAMSLAVAALAGPSQARTVPAQGEPSAERILINRVDFRDPGQVQAVYKRLQQAALFVCGVDPSADRAEREAARACSERALGQAVQSVDRPLLTATYQQSGAPMLARGY